MRCHGVGRWRRAARAVLMPARRASETADDAMAARRAARARASPMATAIARDDGCRGRHGKRRAASSGEILGCVPWAVGLTGAPAGESGGLAFGACVPGQASGTGALRQRATDPRTRPAVAVRPTRAPGRPARCAARVRARARLRWAGLSLARFPHTTGVARAARENPRRVAGNGRRARLRSGRPARWPGASCARSGRCACRHRRRVPGRVTDHSASTIIGCHIRNGGEPREAASRREPSPSE
jgi:hypothetical protein